MAFSHLRQHAWHISIPTAAGREKAPVCPAQGLFGTPQCTPRQAVRGGIGTQGLDPAHRLLTELVDIMAGDQVRPWVFCPFKPSWVPGGWVSVKQSQNEGFCLCRSGTPWRLWIELARLPKGRQLRKSSAVKIVIASTSRNGMSPWSWKDSGDGENINPDPGLILAVASSCSPS